MNDEIVIMSIIFMSLIIPFLVGYILISYTKSLENQKCACSSDVRRKYVKYYGYFILVAALLGLSLFIGYIKYPSLRKLKSVFKIFVLVVQFLATYVIFTYSKVLEDGKCPCSSSWKKYFLNIIPMLC